jgi:hypothetical protein
MEGDLNLMRGCMHSEDDVQNVCQQWADKAA